MKKNNKLKNFLKTNWDLIVAYLSPTIGIILTMFAANSCHGGLECLGVLVIFMFSLIPFGIFMLISIIRNLTNKKLRNSILRWIFTLLPIIAFVLLLFYQYMVELQ